MIKADVDYLWVYPEHREDPMYCDVCKAHHHGQKYCQIVHLTHGWERLLCQPCMDYVAKRRDAGKAYKKNQITLGALGGNFRRKP
jgi:hypothetical protein